MKNVSFVAGCVCERERDIERKSVYERKRERKKECVCKREIERKSM